jgi:RimJ/RimL family protein N-acetyltransferase
MRVGEGARLRDLRLRALADAPEAFAATVEEDAALPAADWEALAAGPGVVLVAGDFSGMAAVYLPEGEDPRVWGTWVAPERRGGGLGRRLVDAAVDWARVRGIERLTLTVSDGAPAAEALYARAGFTPTGEVTPLRSDPERSQAAMALELDRPPRRIETERLLLREFEPGDLDALHDIRSRDEVVRWLYDGPSTLDEDRQRLHRRMRHTRFALTGDALGLAVVHDGVLVADVSLFLHSAEHHQGEIGYITHPDHQGRGYATEASRAVLDLAFGPFALHRVVGRMEARNAASARVLQRLGMRREAQLRENELVKGEWQSELVYAMLADEWRARPRASRGGGSTPPSRPAAGA